ncbi:MAG: hypothetical protein GX102_11440 [Porphyromonadaceae bacterium]|nr:hypothetical protein [Porphyromonadaceae bacterium]
MKKIFTLAIALFAITAFGYSQVNENLVSKKGEQYLPVQGDWSIGFQANDLLKYVGNIMGDGSNSYPELELVDYLFIGKYMDTDNTAYRIIADLYIDNDKETEITYSSDPAIKNITKISKDNAFALNLGVGREWRKGTTRLQGYYGGDAIIGLGSSTSKEDINNPNNDNTPGNPINFNSTEKDGLRFTAGLKGFIGAEYFIFPKIALGAEYSYGLYFFTEGEGTYTETGSDPVKNGKKESSFYLGGTRSGANYGVASLKLSLYF